MSIYLGAETVLVDLWVEARLTTRAAELEAIDAGLSTRVFQFVAPPDTRYPFIVYQPQSPPRDVRGVGVTRLMVDTLYLVKAVAQTDDFAVLAPVAKEIDLAMTSPDVTAVADGLVLCSVREDQFALPEYDAGTHFRHLGGIYKIHAQATA